ncbi:hypothetical protein [Desulfurococcus amylolyticus]|uniref:Uncharacterized protein n=1 Tax=Desulfurococcus amylolyticus DSM 16532 TaxID=768672 RepID=I3XS87_DESAM|nr:hypothetical protein [Desulfurococcus amylolyticus]AFL66811.1 hypothetical protein Desfe_0923 [Desulfurococcus amylolyticus DSM 16532]
MSKWCLISFTMLSMLLLVVIQSFIIVSGEADSSTLINEALSLLARIQRLAGKNINVTDLTVQLNESLRLLQEGRITEAKSLLDRLEDEVAVLEASADTYYMWGIIMKYMRVALVLSIPLLFYLFFPRLYIYLWFRLKRRWVIRESS